MQVNVTVDQMGTIASRGGVRGHEVMIDRPESKGGSDRGAMGGELLLVSLAGCFMSNLLEAIRVRDAAIKDVHIDVSGTVNGAPGRFTDIHMAVSAAHSDPAELAKLITIAERSCLVANTMKEAVNLTISAAEAI
ncbi:MAG: OsmC family protein [Ardenticatenaceae bacterium]|nr:OsmC family protein [Ardenticatenaceae bacterium]